MTTKESKLTYERNNITLSGGPYDIQINQSGAKRRLASYSLTGGVLNLEAQSTQENYISDSTSINISHTTSGTDIVIRLESGSNSLNQNCRVFVNIKAYS